jgi:Cu2+-exporting ATPase
MKQFIVTGMSCAACQNRVEKAVSGLPGVTSCSVSLLTNSMGVEGSADSSSIIKAVEDAGYGAAEKNAEASSASQSSSDSSFLKDTETPVLKQRLIWSLIFLLPLMYLSMGHMMWNWPLPDILKDNHVAMGLIQMILTAVIMLINQKFFISGTKGLLHKAPNMDTLVMLGSFAAFGYSVFALFAMTDAVLRQDSPLVLEYMHEFYFESAATILTLITVGKMLEARSKGKTTDALKRLMRLAPKTATVVRDGAELTVPIESVQVGELLAVRPGESIPADGIITEGATSVNEASLTGESIPVDKTAGDRISAATINLTGFITYRATAVGEDTALSKIIRMVSDAAATKAPIAKIADKVSGVFVPVVITIALITLAAWLLAGESFGYAIARAISVLVISCPCALGLATPVAIMVGNGVAAKNGILFKTSASLEETGKVKTILLDKTGTITKGEPNVTDVLPAEGVSKEELLSAAYSLEHLSEHPLAQAVARYAKEKNIPLRKASDFRALPGHGVSASVDGVRASAGSGTFIRGLISVPASLEEKETLLSVSGKTPLFFVLDGKLLGIIAVADTMKEDSAEAIREMRAMGLRVIMLTGDNARTARAIGAQAGVDEVISGVLPDGKEAAVRKLQETGPVAMVGDGINDAPALTRADIGIAIGAGTDIAIDAADVVLVKSRLTDIPAALRLSRATLKNIRENLFWAFFYNIVGIPLAAGVFIAWLGWNLNPMFAAAAMSLSSFCVVTNALRLNLFNPYDASHDKKCAAPLQNEPEIKEEIPAMTNEKTLTIEGMMCPHCEGRVKKALEAVPGVKAATASAKSGTAVVQLDGDAAEESLKKAVIDAGYEVTGIK